MNKRERGMRWISCLCAAVFLLLLSGHALASREGPRPHRKVSAEFFATVSSLVLYDAQEEDFEETWGQVRALLGEIEAQVSLSQPDSDIARFNALPCGESLKVRPHTAAILRIAREMWEESGGLYDPSVGPLVDLWGFTPRFAGNRQQAQMPYDRPYEEGKMPLPEAKYVEAFARLADFGEIVLDESGCLHKKIPPVQVEGVSFQAAIDLGGIAKGYAVDQVMQLLGERGYHQGYFVCGGSSLAAMENPEREEGFDLGIRAPRGSQASFMRLNLKGLALSSSGDYNHFFTREGVVYCHLINPITGYPINRPGADGVQSGIAAVTLLGESAARDDALSTMLCIMGPERALAYANERLRHRPYVMVFFRQGIRRYEVVTNLEEGQFQLMDERYHLASRLEEDGQVRYVGDLMGF